MLNADGTFTALGHKLTTREVEALMHDLAVARNEMAPQVPVNLSESSINIVLQRDADAAISLTLEGDVTLAVRHRGYGWLVCAFSPTRAAQVGATLFRRATGKTIDFVEQDLPDGDRLQ